MIRLFLVRHGQTEWNVLFKMQGRLDSPLTELGLWQTLALGEALKDEPLVEIHTSPAGRAMLTAQKVAAFHPGVPVVIQNDLTEMDLGPWEGRTREEIRGQWPEDVENFWNSPLNFKSVGGEDYFQLEKRLRTWMIKTMHTWKSGTRLLVSHGVTMQMFFAILEGGGVENLHRDKVLQQCALSLAEWEPGEKPRLVFRNKVDHLDGFTVNS